MVEERGVPETVELSERERDRALESSFGKNVNERQGHVLARLHWVICALLLASAAGL